MSSILALSSSRVGNDGYLESASVYIQDFLGMQQRRIAFLPFASVENDYDAYGATVSEALRHLPYSIEVVKEDPSVLYRAEVVMVGGGNSFKLLHDLYAANFLEIIKEKINQGVPYIGWSAGANIAGWTIGTTNDMPIIQPRSFRALGFLPFQINPHYHNQKAEGFHGETRDQRLGEFVRLNPGSPVVALPEGTALVKQDKNLVFLGKQQGVLFRSDQDRAVLRKEILPGEDLSILL